MVIANAKKIKIMEHKERLKTAIQVSGKILKDILLKKPKHVVLEEFRLAKWHWGKFFKK